MNKLLLAIMILGLGVTGFIGLSKTAAQREIARERLQAELSAKTNGWADHAEAVTALRTEIKDKKSKLSQIESSGGKDDPLRRLLEGKALSDDDWLQLRQDLGIGWNASDKYVLVRKSILKDLHPQFNKNEINRINLGSALLGVSPTERSALNKIIKDATAERRARMVEQTLQHAQRSEPGGDVVAQYTIPPDPEFQQSLSNRVFTGFANTLGSERAELFVKYARAESEILRRWSYESVSMTIRRITVGGEPDLEYEIKNGTAKPYVRPVRYAHYPGEWFSVLFPGGWADIAKREGFELPKAFEKRD